MLHHYELERMNVPTLAKAMKKIAIDEMRHAELLAERIQDLQHKPVAYQKGNIAEITSIELIYVADATLEEETLVAYNKLINDLSTLNDAISMDLLKKILAEEESHAQYFDDINNSIATRDTFLIYQLNAKLRQPGYVRFLTK